MEATSQEMSRFVREVDTFMANYDAISKPSFRNEVYRSGDKQLISNYESALQKSRALKVTIEKTVGAWSAAKAAWQNVTDSTSTVIGDWVDDIRSWFGRDAAPGIGGLGALQLPAMAWVASIISAAFILNKSIDALRVSVLASKAQRENPGLSRTDAVAAASKAIDTGGLFDTQGLAIGAAALLALWFLSR